MSERKHRILLDCDNVLSDFTSSVLQLIEERTGVSFSNEDIKTWNIFKAINRPDLEHILADAIDREGLCIKMKPLPGAKELVDALRHRYEVYVVTSPFLGRGWAYERTRWLQCHFNIQPDRIVHTESKFLVKGDALVDDSGRNLKAWTAEWPGGVPILYDALYNQDDVGFLRARNWFEVIKILEERLR